MKEAVTTVTLDYPFEVDGQQIMHLKMRRPKVRDRLVTEKLGGSQIEMEVRLIGNLCEIAPHVVESLDMADYGKLQEGLADFLD